MTSIKPVVTEAVVSASSMKKLSTTAAAAESELERYVKMTPAQRLREDLLKKLGLTEDDLAKMEPKERAGVEQKITELMQEQLQKTPEAQRKGAIVDTSA